MKDSKYICHLKEDRQWEYASFPRGGAFKAVDKNEDLTEAIGLIDKYEKEEWLVVDTAEIAAERITIDKQKGRRFANGVLTMKTADGTAAELNLDDWKDELRGIEGLQRSELQALENDRNVHLGITDNKEVVWLTDGGLGKWRETREERRKEQEKARKELELKRKRKEIADNIQGEGTLFINPYTFVPLPEKVYKRDKPRGHSDMKEGLSGYFTWRLTFKTPLVLHLDHNPVSKGQPLNYPGSSLRGALRSLHETLTHSCMRILDSEYVSAHRESMHVNTKHYHLAVVADVDAKTGAVTELEICDDKRWVPIKRLAQGYPTWAKSGERIDINPTELTGNDRLDEEGTPINKSKTSNWVMHLTDDAARQGGSYFFVAGQLPGKKKNLRKDVWKSFQRVCEGSKDLIGKPSSSKFIPVNNVGKRRKVDGSLDPGDTVWVELSSTGEIERLKMSIIWRYLGEYPVEDRVDKSFLPCSQPNKLCQSCQIFGSIDPEGDRNKPEQYGYASHIKVGWGVSVDPSTGEPTSVSFENLDLPPLRSPKPSAGNFYLVTPQGGTLTSAKAERQSNPRYDMNSHIARSYWGSELDKKTPRQIRGRKYYWHGDIEDQARREEYDGAAERQARNVAKENTVLEAKVSFDNVSAEQLGWLLAAADPNLFFQEKAKEKYCIQIGGGKPFGYGTAIPEIVDFKVQTANERYGGEGEGGSDGEGEAKTLQQQEDYCVLARQSVMSDGKLSDDFSKTFEALRKVLDSFNPEGEILEGIENNPHQYHVIAYPPGTGDPHERNKNDLNYRTYTGSFDRSNRKFYESFRWFGHHMGADNGDMTSLPDVMDSPYMPISAENWIYNQPRRRN